MINLNWIKHKYKINPLRVITYTTIAIVVSIPIILAFAIFLNLVLNNFNNHSIYYNGVRPTIILTESMEPVIKVNSIIMVEDVEFSELELNDIIRFNDPRGISVVHRVVVIGDGWVITKGDNNKLVDNVKVTEDIFNGRVTEIHNEYAGLVGLVIGRFDMQNISGSMLRIALGFICVAILVTLILLAIYYIFEIITINLFWLKYRDKMQYSMNWMSERKSEEDFHLTVDRYQEIYSKSSIFKKLILAILFRKYYDVLCTEEKHAKRVIQYAKLFDKLL